MEHPCPSNLIDPKEKRIVYGCIVDGTPASLQLDRPKERKIHM
jgi:hypothetical protein